jgi:SPP1 family predicted phage head-tail adaptor
MRAGQLRHRITLQALTAGQDTAGEPLVNWVDVAAGVPANVFDINGREYIAAQAVTNAVTTTIVIRYRVDVTAAMRVICDGVTYNIEAVLDKDGRRREMHLMCVRNVSNG